MKTHIARYRRTLSLILFVVGITNAGIISSYSITNAVKSGFGGWQHEFDGAIIETGTVTVLDISGTTASYMNGSGTLNDGSIGSGDATTQLFATQTVPSPVITLNLDDYYLVENLTLINSDDFHNSITGNITMVDVMINGLSETFATTTEMGNKSEFVNLTGGAYALSAQPANQITLSGFVTAGEIWKDFFAITEIGITATQSAPVPEPSLVYLVMVGLAGLLMVSFTKRFRSGAR